MSHAATFGLSGSQSRAPRHSLSRYAEPCVWITARSRQKARLQRQQPQHRWRNREQVQRPRPSKSYALLLTPPERVCEISLTEEKEKRAKGKRFEWKWPDLAASLLRLRNAGARHCASGRLRTIFFRPSGSHMPNSIADIVCDQKRAFASHGYADRPPIGLVVVLAEKAGQEPRPAPRWACRRERHENDFIATEIRSIPGAVLTDEHAAAERTAGALSRRKRQARATRCARQVHSPA